MEPATDQGSRLDELALPCPHAALVELFATDNELEHLPAEMGQLTSLVKLQLSFNRLQSLPSEVSLSGCSPLRFQHLHP